MSLLLRAAPTSVLDNGLSKLWFRKLLKFQTRRLIFLGEASRQSSSLIRCDHSSVSYCGVLTFEVETFSELTEHRTAVAVSLFQYRWWRGLDPPKGPAYS